MAGYDTIDSGGPLQSAVTPASPVTDSGITQAVSSVQGPLDKALYYNMMNKAGAQAAAEKAQQNTSVGMLTARLSKLADAVQTGQMNPEEAGMRSRAILNSSIAANPTDSEALLRAHNEYNSGAAGKVISAGTDDYQLQKEMYKEAATAGWIKPWMDPLQKENAKNTYFDQKKAEDEFKKNEERYKANTERVKDKLAISGSQMANFLTSQNIQGQQAVGAYTDATYKKFAIDMEDSQRQSMQPGADKVAIQQDMKAKYAAVEATARNLGKGASAGYIENLLKPLQDNLNNHLDFVSGKMTADDLKTHNETLMAQGTMQLLGDPYMAKVTALTSATHIQALTLDAFPTKMQQYVNGVYGPNSEVPDVNGAVPKPANPYDATSKSNYGAYLNNIQTDISTQLSGKGNPQKDQVLSTNIKNIFQGADDYSKHVKGPKDLEAIANFVASDQFGGFVTKNGGIPGDASTVTAASDLLHTQYVSVAQQAVKDHLLTQKVTIPAEPGAIGGGTAVNLADHVDLVFQGGKALFVVKPTDKRTDSYIKNSVQTLNQKVSPIMNTTIRMEAHLGGNKNYQAAFKNEWQDLITPAAEDKANVQ